MKGKGWLVAGAGAALFIGYEVMRIKEAGDKLEIEPSGMTDIKIGGGNLISGNINFKVTNPAQRSLTVNYLNLHAFLVKLTDGTKQEFATITNQAVGKTFAAQSVTTWALPFNIDLLTFIAIAGGNILDAFTGKFSWPTSVLVTGDVNASGFNLPYSKSIPFSLSASSAAPPTPGGALMNGLAGISNDPFVLIIFYAKTGKSKITPFKDRRTAQLAYLDSLSDEDSQSTLYERGKGPGSPYLKKISQS